MKKIDFLFIHGWAGSSNGNWFPWIRKELEKKGYLVEVPDLPNSLLPSLIQWLRALKKIRSKIGPNTVIVGHSLGGITAIHFLLATGLSVRACIFISAPIVSRVSSTRRIFLEKFFQRAVDWFKLKKSVGRFLVLHAENDWVVPYDNGQRLSEILAARFDHPKSGGHFIGKKYPIILKTINKVLKNG